MIYFNHYTQNTNSPDIEIILHTKQFIALEAQLSSKAVHSSRDVAFTMRKRCFS